MPKRHRTTIKGGRKRAFKTDEAYRQHVGDKVRGGAGNNPDGSWTDDHRHPGIARNAMCRDSEAGVRKHAFSVV